MLGLLSIIRPWRYQVGFNYSAMCPVSVRLDSTCTLNFRMTFSPRTVRMIAPTIGIVATALDDSRTGGAETYIRNLLKHLQRLEVDENYVVFVPRNFDLPIVNKRFRAVRCPVDPARRYRRIVWEQQSLPQTLRNHGLDLVHFPYSTVPRTWREPAVVTVHDSLRFVFPKGMPLAERWYRARNDAWIARGKHHVIAVSHDDANRINRNTAIPKERTHVVYHGASLSPRSERSCLVPERGPVLWYGHPYPHKNVPFLIRAFARLIHHHGHDLRLRLIGIRPNVRGKLEAVACQESVKDAIDLLEPLPHDHLLDELSSARLFAFPSLCESFGLPALEAIAAGVPVVCSDLPVFHELYGDHVHYGSAANVDHFAATLNRALAAAPAACGANQAQVESLVARFSWDECARNTRRVYNTSLGSRAD